MGMGNKVIAVMDMGNMRNGETPYICISDKGHGDGKLGPVLLHQKTRILYKFIMGKIWIPGSQMWSNTNIQSRLCTGNSLINRIWKTWMIIWKNTLVNWTKRRIPLDSFAMAKIA